MEVIYNGDLGNFLANIKNYKEAKIDCYFSFVITNQSIQSWYKSNTQS